jgi:hypothetical protein
VTGRTNVVDGGVECLYASLTDVTDLIARRTTLMRSSNRAAAAAEESFFALRSGSSEARGTAVVTGSTLSALTGIDQTGTVTERTRRTRELSGESSAFRAIAARRTIFRGGGVIKAVTSGSACLACALGSSVLVSSCITNDRRSATFRAV